MKRIIVLLVAAILGVGGSVFAISSYNEQGLWPESWPKELEPLRKQATTFTFLRTGQVSYSISFTDREQFEAAWPHILDVKTPGAPIFLRRGERKNLGQRNGKMADAVCGVEIYAPREKWDAPPGYGQPKPDEKDLWLRWDDAYVIVLIVDGEIVDLNRIRLPADTPIIDERFPDQQKKQPRADGK